MIQSKNIKKLHQIANQVRKYVRENNYNRLFVQYISISSDLTIHESKAHQPFMSFS